MKKLWEKVKLIACVVFIVLVFGYVAFITIGSVLKLFFTIGGGIIGGVMLLLFAVFLVWWLFINLPNK
jgi:hypothetical protein